MICAICSGMGCDSCGKLGEQSLSDDELRAALLERDVRTCREMLREYIVKNANLEKRVTSLGNRIVELEALEGEVRSYREMLRNHATENAKLGKRIAELEARNG